MTSSRTSVLLASSLLLTCPTTLVIGQDDAAPTAEIQPEAAQLMGRMTKFYAGLQHASVTSTMTVSGNMLPEDMVLTSALAMTRPNKFALVPEEGLMPSPNASSDGKTITFAMPMFSIFEQNDAPKSFDALTDPAMLGDTTSPDFDPMSMNTIMMLMQDPGVFTALTLFGKKSVETMSADLDSLTIIGTDTIDGLDVTQVRITGEVNGPILTRNADLFIASGDQPWLIAFKPDLSQLEDAGGAPEGINISVKFADWSTDAPNKDAFTPKLEEGWKKVDNLIMAMMQQQMNGDDFEDMDIDFDDEDFEDPEHASVGSDAPDFELDLLGEDGTSVKLSSLRGNVVVLDFWATWCAPCIAGLPTMNKVTSEFKDRGVLFYAVNTREDPRAELTLRELKAQVQKFIAKKKWNFNVLMDDKDSTGNAYKVNGIPHSVVIGTDGKIRSVHVGFGGAKALEEQLTGELEAAIAETPSQG